MEKLSNEQKNILERLNPNYDKMDKFELVDLLENELNNNGIINDDLNDYGLIIEKIIDLILFNNEPNKLYI